MSRSALTVASAHGSLAALKRHHPNASDRIEVATRDLAAEKLAAYVRKVVDSAPPLTPEQRDRIAALLRPAGGVSA